MQLRDIGQRLVGIVLDGEVVMLVHLLDLIFLKARARTRHTGLDGQTIIIWTSLIQLIGSTLRELQQARMESESRVS